MKLREAHGGALADLGRLVVKRLHQRLERLGRTKLGERRECGLLYFSVRVFERGPSAATVRGLYLGFATPATRPAASGHASGNALRDLRFELRRELRARRRTGRR